MLNLHKKSSMVSSIYGASKFCLYSQHMVCKNYIPTLINHCVYVLTYSFMNAVNHCRSSNGFSSLIEIGDKNK